ncbi:hypothetical protein M1555_03470 [Patescibacteria group bacterium]|nr:hypothetical protein [Patescibacteria group bacterium]
MLHWLLTYSPLLYLTQSVWRDEAYSVLVAVRPVSTILGRLSFEPPVYYILLHVWMRIFGTGEIAARSLSFLGFSLATVVVIYWAEKLYKHHWLSWFLPLLFFLNPMLLYYAFEIRSYGWYIFFTVLALSAYAERKWLLLILASVLGFYTHTYMLFVPFVIGVHWTASHPGHFRHPARLPGDRAVRSLALIFLCMIPWFVKIARDATVLGKSWYFPVSLGLVKSVLGNMFTGYEGTPWYLWRYTALLSLVLLVLFVLALRKKSARSLNGLFLLMVFLPLTIVIGISFLKPLFVNRYLIPVTVAEVFLVAAAIASVKKGPAQVLLAGILLLSVIGFDFWYPDKHAKPDIRETISQVNALKEPADLVYADSPLIFFETLYYSTNKNEVFLYNPQHSPFPWYVGGDIVRPSQMEDRLPAYPVRAFLVHTDGTYSIAYSTVTPPPSGAGAPAQR